MGIGLIAGKGRLPEVFRQEAIKRGEEVITIGIDGVTSIESDYRIPIGKVGKLIKILEKRDARKIVMLGKFEHRLIFTSLLSFDLTGLGILRKAKDRKPETIVKTFMNVLEEKGFEFIDPRPYLTSILAGEGPLTRSKPSQDAMEDGLFGMPIAKELASLDVGQTIVVKDKAVVAVEAMEGTQETILRGGKIAGKKTRVVKVARKIQDFRIDVPGVGIETLEAMKESGADALFIEANKVFVIDDEKFYKTADRYRISVYGLC